MTRSKPIAFLASVAVIPLTAPSPRRRPPMDYAN